MPKAVKYEYRDFYYNSTALTRVNKSVKHYHSFYEIYYLEKGVCSYLIEGKLYEMLGGDVVFIPKSAIHKTSYDDAYSRLLINCSDEYLEGFQFEEPFVFRNRELTGKIYGIFKSIEEEYLKGDKYSGSLIKGYMQQLFATVHRGKNYYRNTHSENAYAQKTLKFLEENYTGEITLQSLSESFGISPEHLSRLFKKETGLGFSEYLSLLRLKKAESMLKQNNEVSIAEVAFSCGFNDSNYFCEKFKKVYGVSPLKFKKTYKM